MFKFLKDKLKKTVSKISEKIRKSSEKDEVVEKELREEVKEEVKKIVEEPKEAVEKKEEEIKEEIKETEEEKEEIKVSEKKIETEEEPISDVHKEVEAPDEKKVEEKPGEEKKKVEKPKPKEEKAEEKEEKLKEKEEKIEKEIKEERAEEFKEEKEIKKAKGILHRIKERVVTTTITSTQFEDLFNDLEMALLENNVAVEVVDKIKQDLEEDLVNKPIKRGRIPSTIQMSLKNAVEDVLKQEGFSIEERIMEKRKEKKPYVICFVGINGSGKTTTIAKMARYLMDKKFSVVLAAADTFRAAAIDQLQEHADRLKIKIIKHNYGSDPAAVAFDAIKHAESKNVDVVLIDTAGRMQTNTNLLDEMKKIIRVAKPDLKIFVGESITGNDCVEQAKKFNEAISIDGIILSKTDVDEKGGAAISVSYVTGKPILYIGTGQEYKDLKEFDSKIVVEGLGLA